MDAIIPEEGVLARAVGVADQTKQALLDGTWTYPNTKLGDHLNISCIFDFVLVGGLFLMWGYQAWLKMQKSPEKKMGPMNSREVTATLVAERCMKGSRRETFMTTGVEFITKDEYATLLSLFTVSTITFFKIIGGAEKVNAGYLFGILLATLFVRFIRQAAKSRTVYMFVTFGAILAVLFGFLAYTEAFSNDKKVKLELYIVASVVALIAGLCKMALTVRPDIQDQTGSVPGTPAEGLGEAGSPYHEYMMQRAYAMVDGEFVYELSGMTVMVVTASALTFIFTEMFTVAFSATKWYAVPFYALYTIPMYAICLILYGIRTNDKVATTFNVTYVSLGFFILLALQGHACSLPGPTGEDYATAGNHYCPRFGGLKKDATDGLKLDQGWTIVLEICSAFFILMTFAAMLFTNLKVMSSVQELCVNEGTYYKQNGEKKLENAL